MRRPQPTRHDRAGDALIARYLRELAAKDEPRPRRPEQAAAAAAQQAALAAQSDDAPAATATL